MDVQQPNDLGAGLASAKGDDMSADGVVQQSALVLVGLMEMIVSVLHTSLLSKTYIREHAGDQLAASDGEGEVNDHRPPSAIERVEDVSHVL